MAFDVQGARKAGYSDREIAGFLASSMNFDIEGARNSGYADSEIIEHLAKRDVAVIPGRDGGAPPEQPKPQETSLVDKAIGAGEAALTTLSGLTTGAAGMVGGTVKGLADAVTGSAPYGSQEFARTVEKGAAAGADALTYAPRTASGQDQAAAVGGVMAQAVPGMPLTAEIAAAARGVRPAARAVTDAAKAGGTMVADASRAVAQRVVPGEAAPTPGTMGSVGAAAVDMALQRRTAAESLPVPLKLTKGQETRNPDQLRFEQETAKGTQGAPLRERFADQNAKMAQNFEALIDQSGATTTSAIETGRSVNSALVKAAAQRKAEYRVKYKEAEKAGEMEAPVSTEPVVKFLEENASLNDSNLAGGALGLAQRELVRLGGAEMVDGKLVPRDMPLKNVELLRRQIGNAMDAAPDNATNMRAGVQLRQVIDGMTEGLGGNLYQQARAARRRYAQLFEDNAIVSDLLKTRRGTSDRQVALEDVVKRTVLNGDRESLGKLRRTLQVAGGEDGAQAWRELQGATVRHLMDEATKGVATDQAGNPIISPAKLNNAVRALDNGGRLDFILGKKGAQQIRDINDLAKVVFTTPPGAVNTSNTASVLLAALAEAGTWGGATGLPVPILTGLRQVAIKVKDRRIQQRVEEALNNAVKRQEARNQQPKPPKGKTFH